MSFDPCFFESSTLLSTHTTSGDCHILNKEEFYKLFTDFISKIIINKAKSEIILLCSKKFLLFYDLTKKQSNGYLINCMSTILDFAYLEEKQIFFFLTGKAVSLYKRNIDEIFEIEEIKSSPFDFHCKNILDFMLLSKNKKYLYLSDYSKGILIICKFDHKYLKLEFVDQFSQFRSDLNSSITSNLKGTNIFGNFDIKNSLIHHKKIMKKKTNLIKTPGKILLCILYSDKGRSLISSGTGEIISHFNKHTIKLVKKIHFAKSEKNLSAILIDNDKKILIGNPKMVICYDLKSNEFLKIIDESQFLGLIIYDMKMFNDILVFSGYKDYKQKSTSVYIKKLKI